MAYELQKEQTAIDQSIASELIAITPEWWSAIRLEVKCTVQETSMSLRLTVGSPEGHHDTIEPPSELYDAVLDLYDLFKRHSHPWKRVVYVVTHQPGDEWRFEAEFSY